MESQLIEKQVDLDDCTISYWAGGIHEWSMFLPEKFAPIIFNFIDEFNKFQ